MKSSPAVLLPQQSAAVTLEDCASEPIHLIGEIQPFGYLLAISPDGIVAACSGNVSQLLARPFGEILGRSINEVLPDGIALLLMPRLNGTWSENGVERLNQVYFSSSLPSADIALHLADARWVIEIEPAPPEPSVEPFALARRFRHRLRNAPNQIDTLCDTAVDAVRRLTGFDRVMVYRFDPDGSGEVIAESAEPSLERFLGLHYPASGIPPQARELYKKNLLRCIRDVDDVPVPLLYADPAAQALDLSFTSLRSVSRIHIEYLRNMGVRSSMSISILVRGELWGLFALHHYSPRLISPERRIAAELFGELFAGFIAEIERDRELQVFDLIDRIGADAAAAGYDRVRSAKCILEELGTLIPHDGAVVVGDDVFLSQGQVPPERLVRNLLAHASGGLPWTPLFTESSETLHSMFGEPTEFAGLLLVRSASSSSLTLCLFRRESIESVHWAGNPEKQYAIGPNGPRLTPRKSFELWVEEVRGKSRHWSGAELRMARVVAGALARL